MSAGWFALLGVVTGALITGGINYALQVRRERREVRAVARLMLHELGSTGDSVQFALDNDNPRVLFDEPSEREWKRHHLLLARHLSDDNWDTVALGYGEAGVLTVLVDGEDADARLLQRSGRRGLERVRRAPLERPH